MRYLLLFRTSLALGEIGGGIRLIVIGGSFSGLACFEIFEGHRLIMFGTMPFYWTDGRVVELNAYQ